MRTGPFSKKLAGQVLIATLVIAGVLGVALAAYLNVIHTQNNLTVRSQVWNSCMPLVEAGIEEALAHVNSSSQTNWGKVNGWKWDSTKNAFLKERWIGSGYFTCTIATNSGPNPVITSTGNLPAPVTVNTGKNPFLATATASPPPIRYIARTVRAVINKPPSLAKGLMAKEAIDFSGNNCATDSYNSNLGLYGGPNIGDKGDVASNLDLINVGNADIKGHVSVGPKGKVKIGPNGEVGSLAFFAAGNVGLIEKGWVRNDMNVVLPDVPLPWTAGAGQIPSASGSYTYLLQDKTNYELDSLTLGAGDTLYVTNGVSKLWVKGNVNIQGNIKVDQPGSLKVYVGGNVTLSGTWDKSVIPADLMIYGLPTCTSISVTTGSKLEAAIYAPEAYLVLNGTANLFGSAVARGIKLTGSSSFHYDEALSARAPSIYTVVSWQEL